MPILVGAKSICKFCDLKTRASLKKWVKKYKLPIMRIENNLCASTEEIHIWFSELRKNNITRKKIYHFERNMHKNQSKIK